MKEIKINKLYSENKFIEEKEIKEKTYNFLLNNSFKNKLFNKINKTKINYKIINIIYIIIITFLISYIFILSNKLNKSKFMNRIFKYFLSSVDINLFLKNKTEFYYKTRKKFLFNVNQKYNESNLTTFQNKLNYLIIHESPQYKSKLVDKIKLNEYNKKILGKDICVPILKIYNNINEINLDELPDKFVLKCNHGSGMNLFCKDKSKFNLEKAKKKLNYWLNYNYGLKKCEFHYLFVERKVFASLYLGDNITDYKTFCFNGNPKFISVKIILNKKRNKFIYNYYDLNWGLTSIEYGSSKYMRNPNITIKKPKNLDLIIDYSKKLSKKFAFVRVDFYEVNGTLYLGELTFSPSNALNPFKNTFQRLYLGKLLNLTKIEPSLFNK